jgi:ArsR family transcriptional regulator
MPIEISERLKKNALLFKALGHPTRLLLIEELAAGSKCVCVLTEVAGLDMSTVSKHLLVLKQAGILEDEKRGLQVFYSLKTPCVLDFFKCIESNNRCSCTGKK